MNVANPIRAVLIIGLLGSSLVEGGYSEQKEEFLAIFKEDCDKYGGPHALDILGDQMDHVQNYFNTSVLGIKTANAERQGSPFELIKEFCDLVPNMEEVLITFIEAMKPCVNPENQEITELSSNVTISMLDFVCHNEGDRIATFIATGGADCITAEQEALTVCVPDISDDYSGKIEPTNENVCRVGRDVQRCVFHAMSRCDDKTPAFIVQELFENLLEVIPCEKIEAETVSPPTDNNKDRDHPLSPIEGMHHIVQQKCLKNGGPTAYGSVMGSYMRAANCAQSNIANYPKTGFSFESGTSGQFDFKRYCDYLDEVERCGKSFTNSLKVCLDFEEKKTVDILNDMSRVSQEFLCRGEGEALREFTEAGTSECFASKHQRLMECTTPLLENYVPSGSELARLKQPLVINDQDCAVAYDFQDCIVEVLRECENQSIASFIKELGDTWLGVSPCKNLSKSQTSSVTEISAHNSGERVTSSWQKSHDSFEAKCRSNGGSSAYIIAVEGVDFFEASFRQLIASPNPRIIDSRPGDKSLGSTAIMQCHRAPLLKDLVKYLINSVSPCLEVEELKFLQMIDDVTSTTLDLVCYNEGKRLAGLLDSASNQCLKSDASILLRCARHAFRLDDSYVNEVSHILSQYNEPLNLSAEYCTNLNNFKKCSVQALTECESHQTTLDVLSSWFKSIENKLACTSLLQADTSRTTERYHSSTERPQRKPESEIFSSPTPTQAIWGIATHGFSESYLKDRCLKNGGVAAYEVAKEIPKYIEDGVDQLQSHLVQLKADMNVARSHGELDVVFMKYCYEVPVLNKSINYIAASVKPCLDPESRENADIILKTIDSTLEFWCQNDGDRLTKFVAAGGLECAAEKQQSLHNCILSYIRNIVPSTGVFTPGSEECLEMKKAQRCIIDVMAECEDKTLAKTIEDLINTNRFVSPCSDVLAPESS